MTEVPSANEEAPLSEERLYRLYLGGDAQAGDELMLRLGDALTAYLDAFLHNAEDAEELMLDCFAVLLVKKPRIQEGHFLPYLYKMARYKANRLWRNRFRHQEFELDEDLPSRSASPEDEVWKGERNAILRKCLNRIAPQYREALYLYYDMGMSYAEAAEAMGGSVKKVEDLLRNGKKRLRTELEKEGITHADI